MKSLFFVFLLSLLSLPINLFSTNCSFDTTQSVLVEVKLNGNVAYVPLNTNGSNCPALGLGLMTITGSSGTTYFSGPVSPNGNSFTYGEIVIIGGFTYGEIVIIGGFASETFTVTYVYGGCTYNGTF